MNKIGILCRASVLWRVRFVNVPHKFSSYLGNILFCSHLLNIFNVERAALCCGPITGLDRPLGLQEVEAPRPPLPPGNIPGTHFC